MGQRQVSYARYLARFENQKSPERLYDVAGAMAGAIELSRNGGKIDGSMRYFATYRLADGRIAEVYTEGIISSCFVWDDDKHYGDYVTPMPFNVYQES